jgi:protein-S-isoprenylcysteine O-methyltransferase Ste14
MERKVWFNLVGQFSGMALALFVSAGTIRWPAGWTLLGVYAAVTTYMTSRLRQVNPELLAERRKFHAQPGQPHWDRTILRILMALIAAWLVVAGFDRRWGWSRMPMQFQLPAGALTGASLWAAYRLMLQNAYLAPTVRVQGERGHVVVSGGAYGIVRHPFYAVLIPFFFGGSILLGSWPSAFVSALIALLLAFRCVREERYLSDELEGYADYMRRVPCRLIPHVW